MTFELPFRQPSERAPAVRDVGLHGRLLHRILEEDVPRFYGEANLPQIQLRAPAGVDFGLQFRERLLRCGLAIIDIRLGVALEVLSHVASPGFGHAIGLRHDRLLQLFLYLSWNLLHS